MVDSNVLSSPYINMYLCDNSVTSINHRQKMWISHSQYEQREFCLQFKYDLETYLVNTNPVSYDYLVLHHLNRIGFVPNQNHGSSFVLYNRRENEPINVIHNVFNDMKHCTLTFQAQFWPGFVLIESKSIKGEVKVNDLGEWTRSLSNKWSGSRSLFVQEASPKIL